MEFLSKFPPHMIRDLDAHHHVNVETPLKDIREKVFKYIMQSEIVSETIANLSALHPATDGAKKWDNRPTDQKPQKSEHDNRSHSWENWRESDNTVQRVETSLFTNSAVTSRNQSRSAVPPRNRNQTRDSQQSASARRPLCCPFCDGEHIYNQCPKFTTAASRRRRVIEVGRCTACLGRKHVAKHCRRAPSYRTCFHCQREHPSALCPVTFPEKSTGASGSDHGLKPKSSTKADSAKPCEKVKSVTFMTKTPIKQSRGQTMLMTAWCSLMNPTTGELTEARVILDSGSSRDYVTERVARRLNLQPESTEHIGVNVFGSGSAAHIKSAVVSFGIKLRDGTVKFIEANTTPLISNASVLPMALAPEEKATLQPFVSSLADKLEDYDGQVDILLGASLFWDIITGTPYRSDSDIKLIPSKLGILLAGTVANSSPSESSLTTFLCLGERSNVNGDVLELSSLSPRTKSPTMKYVDEFRNLETTGITDDSTRNHDNLAYEKFSKTIPVNDKDNRPTHDLSSITDDELARVQRTRMLHSCLAGVPRDDEVEPVGMKKIIDLERFSSLKEVLKTTVLVLKFIKRMLCDKVANGVKDRVAQNTCVGNGSDRSVCADDTLIATKIWVRSVQRSDMKDVLETLAKRKRHNLAKSLGLRMDEDGIMQTCSRFVNSDLPVGVNYPKLLPANGHFTKLVVLAVQCRVYHAGEAHTSSQLRREFWKPWRRRIVKTASEKIWSKIRLLPKILRSDEAQSFAADRKIHWKFIAGLTKAVTSPDGEVSSAEGLLPNKWVIKRSVVHLYPLEVSHEETDAPETNEKSVDHGRSEEQFFGFSNADVLKRFLGDISVENE